MFVAATVLALGYDAMMCWKCVLYYTWAFQFKPATDRESGITSGRLELTGPWGDYHEHTNNRAQLRAVLAALRFRNWPGEGFTKLVIATDSDNREAAKNRDLWQALLGEFERLEELGLMVGFWKIHTGLNRELKKAAKRAVEDEEKRDYCDVVGALV
ncbi:hypothetical protein CEP51_012860 [Fusarium floridanum]|uniref:RNase H type-1 domain-containing protein n=1 Tax=Fusarium floridanum TaxID=1325733 RepID=A0A428QLU2_9HYPO|nr:hypothetical protein CEP51_012860 [Fusarium floridanum]